MKSGWIDADAESLVDRYAPLGIGRDLALRVYTTRLLGQDPKLVLRGGGNTSVKTRARDLLGDEVEVLCVKGSGWDMATIEPAGLPAVRLDVLKKLRARTALYDEDMVRVQRANLLDPMAPNPSVETLLHAFIPAKFIDHTHSTAVLSLTDQPEGSEICSQVYAGRLALVPYLMPGFGLAKKAAEISSPRGRTDRAWRVQLEGCECRGRLPPACPRISRKPCSPRFRQRRRGSSLWPGGRGDA